MEIWIVTRGINEYYQEGEYFVAAYIKKPDFSTLKKLLPKESDVTIGKLTRGGGRQDSEGQWYFLKQVNAQ